MSRLSYWLCCCLLASLAMVIGGWGFRGPSGHVERAQRPAGMDGDRLRIMLGFHVRPEAVRKRLLAPWQLSPLDSGPYEGANLFVVLVDRIRDDDAEGTRNFRGANRLMNIAAPARHLRTGRMASIILGGWASNAANVPGYYQVYRAATVHVEQTIEGQSGEAEDVTYVWEARDTAGHGGLELRLRWRREFAARRTLKGEAQVVSGKDPTRLQRHRFDATVEVVKSVPEGVDEVQHYSFRLTAPEYSELFDGTEQLISIRVSPWYMRHVFMP